MHLTTSETLLLHRRRQGKSQADAAGDFKVPVSRYVAWETGRLPFTGRLPKLSAPLKHEVCFLKRRRTGKTQEELADELGFSKYWIRLMEQGQVSSTSLERYWKC